MNIKTSSLINKIESLNLNAIIEFVNGDSLIYDSKKKIYYKKGLFKNKIVTDYKKKYKKTLIRTVTLGNTKKDSFKMILLQIAISVLGIIGTTSLSFFFVTPLIYLFSMTIFGVYNLLQIIHFSIRKLWFMIGLFVFFFCIGLFGYVEFMIANKQLILQFLGDL